MHQNEKVKKLCYISKYFDILYMTLYNKSVFLNATTNWAYPASNCVTLTLRA